MQRLASLVGGQRLATSAAGGKSMRVPAHFDLSDFEHVYVLDQIRERYSAVLMREDGEFKDCLFKPASLLPFPKQDIHRALTAMLDFAEGRIDSPYLPAAWRTQHVVDAVRTSLTWLDYYIEAPAAEIPTGRNANVAFGFQLLDPAHDYSVPPGTWGMLEKAMREHEQTKRGG